MTVIDACHRLNIDVITLFRLAYLHIFNKPHPSGCWDESAQFRMHGVVPKYVVRYLATLAL